MEERGRGTVTISLFFFFFFFFLQYGSHINKLLIMMLPILDKASVSARSRSQPLGTASWRFARSSLCRQFWLPLLISMAPNLCFWTLPRRGFLPLHVYLPSWFNKCAKTLKPRDSGRGGEKMREKHAFLLFTWTAELAHHSALSGVRFAFLTLDFL